MIISSNRGEPLVLAENPLAGIALTILLVEGETIEFLNLDPAHGIFSSSAAGYRLNNKLLCSKMI